MSYMWFEWTQYDKLSKICRDVEDIPRKKCINLKWKKIITNVKIAIT